MVTYIIHGVTPFQLRVVLLLFLVNFVVILAIMRYSYILRAIKFVKSRRKLKAKARLEIAKRNKVIKAQRKPQTSLINH